MTCPDYEILINREIDKGLSQRERAALEAHLAVCPSCARLAKEYALLDRLLIEHIGQVEVPADLVQSVMAALPSAMPARSSSSIPLRHPRRRRLLWRWVSVGTAAAAVILGFSVGGWFDNAQQEQDIHTPIVAENDLTFSDPTLVSPTKPENTDTPNQQDLLPPEDEDDQEETILPSENVPPDTDAPPVDTANEQTADPPTSNMDVMPSVDPSQTQDITYNNEFSLPQVTYGNTTHGAYTLLTLAAVAGYDATLPRVSGNTVTFYVETEDAYLEYQVDINGAAPVFLEKQKACQPSAPQQDFQ